MNIRNSFFHEMKFEHERNQENHNYPISANLGRLDTK